MEKAILVDRSPAGDTTDTAMEGTSEGAPGNPAALETDSGLDLLFPLYSFLRGTCQEAVCRLLIATFSDAQYVKENIGKCVKLDMTLFNFFCHINQTIKNMREDKTSKKSNPKNPLLSFQAPCSYQQNDHQRRQQSHRHEFQHKGQQCPAHPHTSQPQSPAKCQQSAARCTAGQQNKWPLEIQNVHEKEKILVKVTVGKLLHKDKTVFKVLQELDLNFVLSILLHELIGFKFDEKLKDALCKMKKVRKTLVHARYNFSDVEFDENLSYLVEAVGAVNEVLLLPDHKLQECVDLCRAEAISGNKVREIVYQLMLDIHEQYSPPDPTFVSPTISYSPMHHREVIEDVQKFIESQQDDMDPILLCGEYKEEKTLVFEKLAFKAKNSERYSLVLYLKDSHRRSYCHRVTPDKDSKKAVQEFQNQLYSCLRNLAPKVFYEYGEDAVRTAIRIYQKNILFLINWNVSMWGPVQSEMQRGTWVMACNAKEPPKGGWQILRLEPYSDLQVREVLQLSPNSEDLLRCYNYFNSQHILSSWDMIKIFCEVNQTISCGTDFEVVNTYVSETMRCAGSEVCQGKQDLLTLGKLAFSGLCNRKYALGKGNIVDVQECVCDAFLNWIENEGWYFKHSVVRDFLAAKYVVFDPSATCRNWMKENENVAPFIRVFKFVYYVWSEEGPRIKEENLRYMETFLRTLLRAPNKRSQSSDKEAKSGNQKSIQKKKMVLEEYENKFKNPFDKWDFLLELDLACAEKLLKRVLCVLSDIACWHFSDTDCLDAAKLTRLGRVLKKVTLNKKNPVIIKLKSSANVALLTKLWRMIRGIDSLYGCVDLMVTIGGDDADHLNYKDKVEEFLQSIADAQVALYFSKYKGPLFSSCIPSFFKCMCMHYLKVLEVSVYDIKSLHEVMMACRVLPSLQEVFIKVNLLLTEQVSFRLAHSVIPIKFPEKISVHITFKYFPQIQQLLDIFERCDQLCSLSIHELYVFDGFKLNLSRYSNLKSLNIRCKPKCSGERPLTTQTDQMVVDEVDRLPRCHWMLPFMNGLTLPQKIERLLLRNVEFIDDSHQNFIILFLEKYNINRLLILDTQLSLTGVGQLLCSQTKVEEDVKHDRERKLRRHESHDIRKLGMRRTRICKEEREAMKWNKPDGKEIVITSEGSLCNDCSRFPCMCPLKVNRDEGCNSFEKMIEVISDMYCCNIQTFSYSFNHCTIRKDMCGDLRVQCIMKGLSDSDILEIESRWYVKRFFLPLLLAHSVSLEDTVLSPVGVAKVAEHLKDIKGTNEVDPFSLIIETSWHPTHSCSPFTGLKDFLKTAEYLSVVHFWCNCRPKCFHLKKTYRGNVEEVIKPH